MINKATFKTLCRQWLLQLLILWVIINIYDVIFFLYRTYLWGQAAKYDPIFQEIFARFIRHNFYQNMNGYLILVTLLAEINYQYIFKRYNWYTFTFGVIITAIVAVSVLSLFRSTKHDLNLLEPFCVIAGYAFGYTLLREFFYHRLYNLKIRASRSENELQALKQQLNPHFLFNTLNYVYGTALEENATRTAEAIDMMAGMMRYTVTGMQETFTPLSAEIEFIGQYLSLQRLRMPVANARLVHANIQASNQHLLIAPMMLMPFMENAFKYGINPDVHTDVNINVDVVGAQLFLKVSNTIVNHPSEVSGTNSGITLTRKRLQLLYPNRHELIILAGPNLFEVKLRLDLH